MLTDSHYLYILYVKDSAASFLLLVMGTGDWGLGTGEVGGVGEVGEVGEIFLPNDN